MRAFGWGVVLLLTCSCGGEPRELVALDLRTDLVAGQEFHRVEALPVGCPGEPVVTTVAPGTDTLSGIRVAEWTWPVPSVCDAVVELVTADGSVALRRHVRITFEGALVVTVTMTRDCRGVVCPLPDGAPSLSACLGGMCVDPSCTSGDCRTPACTTDADCAAGACGTGRCIDGLCLAAADAGDCEEGFWCDPDRGCTSSEATLPPLANGWTTFLEARDPLQLVPREDALWVSGDPNVALSYTDGSVSHSTSPVWAEAEGRHLVGLAFGGPDRFVSGESGAETGGVVVAGVDATGNVVWQDDFGGSVGSDRVDSLGTSGDRVVGAGELEGDAMLQTGLSMGLGGADVFLVGYGLGGLLDWSLRLGGPGSDAAVDLAVDPSGVLHVVGIAGAGADLGVGPAVDDQTAFLLRVTSDGTPTDLHTWSSPGSSDDVRAVAAGADGTVCVAGEFDGGLSFPEAELVGEGGDDGFVRCFEPDGSPGWAAAHTSDLDVRTAAVAIGAEGRVYVAGTSYGPLRLGGLRLGAPTAGPRLFVVVHAADGTPIAGHVETFSRPVLVYDLAVGPDGHAYLSAECDDAYAEPYGVVVPCPERLMVRQFLRP